MDKLLRANEWYQIAFESCSYSGWRQVKRDLYNKSVYGYSEEIFIKIQVPLGSVCQDKDIAIKPGTFNRLPINLCT